jgi:class 3 adenylate cyclase
VAGAEERDDEAEYIAAGLYDPETNERTGRLELLRWLRAQGHSLEELTERKHDDSLGSLAGDRRLVPGERLTRAEAIGRSGVTAAEFDALSLALQFQPIQGAPDDEAGYTAEELDTIRDFAALSAFFSPEEALSLVRTAGSSVARIADAAVSLFLADIESPHVLAGESELDLAKKVYDTIGVIDGFAHSLDPLLRRHLLQAIERTRRTTVGETERFQYRFAVGFVDLVGFTSVSAGMDPAELATFIRDFEERTHDCAVRHGGRVVKLIGDEVMFVAEDASAACRVGHALMEGFVLGEGTVVPRGGVAFGHVLPRGGDYYGEVVNLAARLVDEAVPRELLVTEAVADAAGDCEFEPAGRRMVKGFADPIVVQSLVRTG